jgi:hypothetical protein
VDLVSLLNKNAVQLIVRKEDWDHDYWDDVSLALLLMKKVKAPLMLIDLILKEMLSR